MLSEHSRFSRPAVRSIIGLAVALAFVFTSTVPTFAAGGQTGNVSGVVDDQNGKPIANAKTTLASPSGTYTQFTDGAGNFTFLGVAVDTYTISVEAKGFEPLGQAGITVEGGATNNLGTVKLQPTNVPRTIARVTAHSQSSAFQPNQTIPQFTVAGNTMVTAQGKAASSDEHAVLLSVPGFQIDSAGGLILQGSLVDQVRYQLDGIDFTDPGFNTNINADFFNGVGTVQVVPGAGDPSQGNAGAGVVNMVVRRGTYPASGLFDIEADAKPFQHQLNLQYGLASPNGRLSDYFSFFGVRNAYQYGAFGLSAADANALYNRSFRSQNDFVNNLVYRFGKNNSQSLQALYLNDWIQDAGNYGGIQGLGYPFTDSEIPVFFGQYQAFAGISPNCPGSVPPTPTNPQGLAPCPALNSSQYASILGHEQGQAFQTQLLNNNLINETNSSLLKFEYDNQFNSSTYLALRFFHQNNFADSFGNGPELFSFAPILRTEQTAGGSRTGGNFELNKQVNTQNLLTLSGSYSFNRPNFASNSPYVGLYDLGGNGVDFLRPPNPNLPVSGTNPCPITGGCYLQQFFFQNGGTPLVPGMHLSSNELQDTYGMGFRDQIQATDKLRLDLGIRYDLINEGFGNNLFYADENIQAIPGNPSAYYIKNYPFVETPHFLQPRAGASYRIDNNDAVQFSYGRAIILQGLGELASPESQTAYQSFANIPANPNWAGAGDAFIGYPPVGFRNCFPFLPFPIAGIDPLTGQPYAAANSQPSYKGTVAGANPSLVMGRTCRNYAEELYAANDAFYPEVTAVQPGVFNEYDLNFSHQFKNGSALKIAPFYRQGTQVQAITANLIDVNGSFQPGTLTSQSVGVSKTTGISMQFTLPDHPYGLTGFISASYVNELTNTPPGSDNPNGQDFEPLITVQSLTAGNLYRAGFVSPLTATMGLSYKTHSGFRINPVLTANIGYPYGVGLLTPFIYNGRGINVPGTNVTNQYAPNGAVQWVDPANPGSIFSPNIAATRGTPERAAAGAELTKPNVIGNLTIEYSPARTRSTFGVQVLNVFANSYAATGNQPLLINGNYYPVTTGVAAPLTGQNINNTVAPKEVPLRYGAAQPNLPYLLGISTSPFFRFYYQLAL